MYSFASATTSLLGAKSSRRSVASTSRTLLSRLAREEASRRLGGTVVVLIRVLSEYPYFTPDLVPKHGRFRGQARAARAFHLSAYDAVHLDLARRERLPLATFDDRLRNAAAHAGVELLR